MGIPRRYPASVNGILQLFECLKSGNGAPWRQLSNAERLRTSSISVFQMTYHSHSQLIVNMTETPNQCKVAIALFPKSQYTLHIIAFTAWR